MYTHTTDKGFKARGPEGLYYPLFTIYVLSGVTNERHYELIMKLITKMRMMGKLREFSIEKGFVEKVTADGRLFLGVF